MTPSVQLAWARRTAAEYRSSCLASELLHWLMIVPVSPDTVALCHRIVADELAHAELSREVLLAAGGDGLDVPLVRDELRLHHEPTAPLELRCLAVAADVFCCGETVAVPLFAALRERATEPAAVAALDRIRRDEAVHRAFGWQLLDELLDRHGEPARAWLDVRVPGYVQRIVEAYQVQGAELPAGSAGWGLMVPERYAELTRQCVDQVIRPRFADRGLTV